MRRPPRHAYPRQHLRLFTLTLILSCLGTLFSTVHAQTMVTLSMGQPGYYGRIEIGNAYPQPALLFPNAIMGNPGVYTGEPVYMHVPPAHAYAWSRYCSFYGACDWMVYFVEDGWYNEVYVPGFRSGFYAPPPVYVAPPVYVPVRPYRPYPYYYPYRPHYDGHDRYDEHHRHDAHHAPHVGPPPRDHDDRDHHRPPRSSSDNWRNDQQRQSGERGNHRGPPPAEGRGPARR
ncbi:MAG TPA: hypothetical protein VN028_06010 [Rhodocyclaceae bacterium]|nr:hypothetical protein [Rhodocyclaceae bacterium]